MNHRHDWAIDPPNGPMSHGVCVKCGVEKDFPNDGYDNTKSGAGSANWRKQDGSHGSILGRKASSEVFRKRREARYGRYG